MGRLRRLGSILWAAGFPVGLGLVVWFAGQPTDTAQVLAAVSIVIVLVHACFALGVLDAMVCLALCLVVTFTIENIGVATGAPFGHYHFVVDAGLPHVGAIPLIVGFLYFGMGMEVARPGTLRIFGNPLSSS